MSKYTMVDEAYSVFLENSINMVARRADDLFFQDGTKVSRAKVMKFFREYPHGVLYLYREDEDGENRWNRDWYYRVEKH